MLKSKKYCSDCPYKLGLVLTLDNPCPSCKLEGYAMKEMFKSSPQMNPDVRKTHNEPEI